MENKTTTRSKPKTIQRILNALEEVIIEHGVEGIGVALVAQKAKVSRTLIHQYFGGAEELLSYYIQTGYLFNRLTPELMDRIRPMYQGDMAQVWSRLTILLFQEFRSSKVAREVLKANVDNSPFACSVSNDLDIEFTNFVQNLSMEGGVDAQATSAILLGGLSYLTIMAHYNRSMIGIDLRSEAGWQRVQQSIIQIYEALGQQLSNKSQSLTSLN